MVMWSKLQQLWRDDCGSVLAVEYTMLMGVAVAGTLPAIVAVRDAVNANLAQTAVMIQSFTPQFTFSGWQVNSASVPGIQSPVFVPTQPVMIQQVSIVPPVMPMP